MDPQGTRSSGIPVLTNARMYLNADAVYYGNHMIRQVFTTKFILSDKVFEHNKLINRVIKAGKKWGVVRSNHGRILEVWGDLTGEIGITVFPTFHLKTMD